MEEAKALDEFRRTLAVQRRGMSNLVSVSYTAEDPQYAAQVANTVSATYLEKLEQDRSEAAETASSWLRERLQEVGPNAQVVSEALPPVEKSNVRGVFLIAAAIGVGAAGAVVLILASAVIDNRVKTPEQLARISGRPCFGLLPTLRTPGARGDRHSVAVLAMIAKGEPAQLWHTLRHIDTKVAKPDGHGAPLVVGFTSTATGEGATTVAANFAAMKVLQGQRTLLVDGQLYDSQLSRILNGRGQRGLRDISSSDGKDLLDYVIFDKNTGADLLPVGLPPSEKEASGVPSTRPHRPGMNANARLTQLFALYDVVVIDLPPLIAIGDVQSAARMVDQFVLVVEWGRLTSDVLNAALTANPEVQEKLAGAVLNRADQARMRRVFSPLATLLQKQSTLSRAW
jgi:Mrp family chromosome partitioning ATPase